MIPPARGTAWRCASWMCAIALWSGCGAAQSAPTTPAPRTPADFYPLAPGHVWSYDVDTGTGVNALAIVRVVGNPDGRFEVSTGSETLVYTLRPEGIFRPQSETWLLRGPLETTTSWPTTQGRTARITAIDETVETIAGAFRDCLVVEERGDPATTTIKTTYCPSVGPVVIETRTPSQFSSEVRVTARLRGYILGEAP